MKHVVLYRGHLYKLFLTKKIWPGWQGGSKKVKIWPRMGLAFIYFWPRSLLEAPKCAKDPWNTPKMIPPTAPDWFESIYRVQCKSSIKSWDDDVTTWSLKDHVVTLCLRTISVRLKSECIQKLIKHLYFVHLFRYPAKKNVKMLKNTIFCKWYQGVTFAI